MSDERGVSIFVPAYNEETDLRNTVKNAMIAARAAGPVRVEILIVNDGSRDGTAAIIKELESQYSNVRAIHQPTNVGLGVCFRDAVNAARYPKIALFNGDGMVSTITLRDMLSHAYDANFVCCFVSNTESRSKLRNFISSIYTMTYTGTFNIPLKYINATPVYPVETVKRLDIQCRRYSFPAEVTVKVLRSGCSFREIPGFLNPNNMASSALRLKNLFEVVFAYLRLLYAVYIGESEKYSKRPVRVMPPPIAE